MPSSYPLQAASSGIGRDRRLQRSCLLGLARFCCWRSRGTSIFCPTPPKTRMLSPQFSTAHARLTLLGGRPDGDWRVSEAETQWEIVPHTGLALQVLDARLSPSPEHIDPVPVSPTRCTPRQSPKIRKGSQSAALPKRACRTATSMAGALCTHRDKTGNSSVQ